VRSAAATWATRGVRVNAVAPGLTATRQAAAAGLTSGGLPQEVSEQRHPVKHVAGRLFPAPAVGGWLRQS
jgi:NAD(P)-dependent dehydrogenase (short-subunit alcohol dehydrogenase family)